MRQAIEKPALYSVNRDGTGILCPGAVPGTEDMVVERQMQTLLSRAHMLAPGRWEIRNKQWEETILDGR